MKPSSQLGPVGKHLSDTLPVKLGLKQEYALWPSFYKMPFTTVHANQAGLKLNGTHHLLFYADDFNIVGTSIHTSPFFVGGLLIGDSDI
jgi:hypothetical protein